MILDQRDNYVHLKNIQIFERFLFLRFLVLFLILYMSNFHNNYSVFVNNIAAFSRKYNFYLCTIIFILWHIEFKANIQVNNLVQQSFYMFRKLRMFLHWDEENIEMTRSQDSKAIFFKMGAAPIGEMYMNGSEKVYVVRQRDFFGPLIPQEIKELVLAKYREDLFLKWYNY